MQYCDALTKLLAKYKVVTRKMMKTMMTTNARRVCVYRLVSWIRTGRDLGLLTL